MLNVDLVLWEKVLEKVIIEKVPERKLVREKSEKHWCQRFYKMVVRSQIFCANFLVFCATLLFLTQGEIVFFGVMGDDYCQFLIGIYTAMIFTLAYCTFKLHVVISAFVIMWQILTTFAAFKEATKSIYYGFDPQHTLKDYDYDHYYCVLVLWIACSAACLHYSMCGLLVLIVFVDELLDNPINYRSHARECPRF